MLQFFKHIDNGFIAMTVSEYHQLPNFVKEAWNEYKHTKTILQSQAR